MKILWLSHLVPYPPKGGVLQRTFNMIKEAGKYHQITLLAFNQAQLLADSLPESNDPLALAKTELLKSVDSIYVLPIPEETFRAGRYLTALKALVCGNAYNMEWLKSPEFRQKIEETIAKEEFDVVHIDTISLCVYSYLFENLPIVLNHHNFESSMLESRLQAEKNPLKNLYFKIEASRLLKSEIEHCRQSDLNLTCSEEDSEAIREATHSDNCLCVPNGVDVSYFFPDASAEVIPKSIVIVGGLSWYPNRQAVEYFIREIWPRLKAQVPNISVDIVGRGPTQEMLALAESDKSFRVHGFVDDVREYLWRAQFYMCSIRTGGGTKLKILDALASGCCIVADPFACKGIQVQNGLNVVYADKPQDYVDRIVELLENPEKEAKLRAAGPELIRNQYSYKSIGRLYANAVESLALQRRAK